MIDFILKTIIIHMCMYMYIHMCMYMCIHMYIHMNRRIVVRNSCSHRREIREQSF